MNLHETFLAVLAALVVLQSVATALGAWLEQRATAPAQAAWIAQLNQRIRGAWGIVLVFALAFALGGEALTVVFAIG